MASLYKVQCWQLLILLFIDLMDPITSQQDTMPHSNSTNNGDEDKINLSPPDCQCITGWTSDDIDCSSQSTIEILETFLTSKEINCYNECNDNIECQQSYSLLIQHYEQCPLGTISELIIRSYHYNSTCIKCIENNKHYDESDPLCKPFISSANNCSSDSNVEDYMVMPMDNIELNCALLDDNDTISMFPSISPTITPNDNQTLSPSTSPIIQPTMSPTLSPTPMQCTSECSDDWVLIASYQRQCKGYQSAIDYGLLDELFADTSTDCKKDCHFENANQDYTPNCSSVANRNWSDYGTLDILSLRQQVYLCFYGLNIDDPTNYDLICVEKKYQNLSGIVSYNTVSNATNDNYWGEMAYSDDMDIVWLLITAAMVFFMQLGFTLLEAGAVKAGNVQNIMFKNMMDAAICCITYWIVGYGVAYGDPTSPDANGFIGVENILIESETWADWFFHMAFACTASTIVSGAVAERLRLEPYFIYTIVISCWVYPVVVHWIWSTTGWLSPFNPDPVIYAGAIDFAGSSVVHMIGGITGLCGAYFVGPRLRRFDTSKEATSSKFYNELMHQFEFGHNVPFQVLGLLILWFGFYGFNPGSTLRAQNSMDLASKIAVNTTLSAAAGGITGAFVARYLTKSWHIPKLVNGVLAALASITASCAVVSNGWAILIGFVGSLLYYGSSYLVIKYEIDDPLDAFAVHGIGGSWGVLSAALFSTPESIKFANYPPALYEGTNWGERLATNLLLLVVVALWTLFWGCVTFGSMKLMGILRVTEETERTGIDVVDHGGSAVNMKKPYSTQSLKSSSVKRNNDPKHPFQKHGKHKYHNSATMSDDSIDRPNDGDFNAKVKESSLEKRLDGIAESDEEIM